jgi:hypothetical protein
MFELWDSRCLCCSSLALHRTVGVGDVCVCVGTWGTVNVGAEGTDRVGCCWNFAWHSTVGVGNVGVCVETWGAVNVGAVCPVCVGVVVV